jgi:phosphoglycolate phosphatase
VMVGDTTFDMAMAVAAGVAAIGVAWGYHQPGALYGAGAVTVVDDAAGLRGLLAAEASPLP